MSVERLQDVNKIGLREIALNFLVEEGLGRAKGDPRRRHLWLMHRGDYETTHRMVNCMLPGTEVGIHEHTDDVQVEVFYPLKGQALVVTFNNDGDVSGCLLLDGDDPKYVEISPRTWHTVIPLTPFAALETKGHPPNYDPATDKHFAPWAPQEGEEGIGAYTERIKTQCLQKLGMID